MWSSLQKIEIPESLTSAYALFEAERKVFFAGGTYLVAEKNPAITTLIDVNHLINSSVEAGESKLRIGAGATLQEVINTVPDSDQCKLPLCAKLSCASKNIRNQRTIGGEIAFRRLNSELYVYLFTLNADLEVITTKTRTIPLREWDEDGIINAIEIDTGNAITTGVQRFALLPSAPAFVFLSAIRRKQNIEISVAGNVEDITHVSLLEHKFTDEYIQSLSATAVKQFYPDQYGSLKYKQTLIQVGLQRIRDEL